LSPTAHSPPVAVGQLRFLTSVVLGEKVLIQPLELQRSADAHTDAILDHQVRQLSSVD